ncbi:hypothetical protein AAVH_20760 [Aphelenchoides avenae]|nr:hypothetical protein AAVH_20760 [Aphelenchus avenae]
MLDEQCALKLKNRDMAKALRMMENSQALLIQENARLLDALTSTATPPGKVGSANDAAAVLNGLQLYPVDAIQAKNYIARLPFEMRGDIFLHLDRFSLDRAGFACPQFRSVVGCLVGGSLRLLTSVRLNVKQTALDEWDLADPRRLNRREGLSLPHANDADSVGVSSVTEEGYEFDVSLDYSSCPTALMSGSTGARVNRQWSFSDGVTATSHFIGLVRHAYVQQMSLSGPLPLHLLETLASTDVDVSVDNLEVADLSLTGADLALGRSALTSFNTLRELTLGDAIPLNFITDEFLVALKNMGVTKFEFRSKHFTVRSTFGLRRALAVDYNGTYPSLDAGITAFLFNNEIDDQLQGVELGLPAASVPREFCKRILEAALANGSHNTLTLSFVAVNADLIVELEGFEEYASGLGHATVVYTVPQSPASETLLELKIMMLEGAPNGSRLVKFRRFKKPAPSTAGDDWGEGGGGFGNHGFGNHGFGGNAVDYWG